MISIARPVFVITFVILFFAAAANAQEATGNPATIRLTRLQSSGLQSNYVEGTSQYP